MPTNIDERSLLDLAAAVVSAVEDKAQHYRHQLGEGFDPLLAMAAAQKQSMVVVREKVQERQAFIAALTGQLDKIATLIADKSSARTNAAEAEQAIRRFLQKSGNLLLMNGPTARGLVGLDAKLKISQIRINVRKGAVDPDQLEDDFDQIARLAGSARLARVDMASSVLQGAIAILGVAEAEIKKGEETLNEIKRAIDAMATVIRIVTQVVAIVA